MRSARTFTRRFLRAAKLASRDGRVPRPIRWAGAAGLLPVPGPFDEIVLEVVGGVLWVFYREQLAEAWRQAGSTG